VNKTNIGWCDYTWNPVVGCKNNCPYCYAKKIFQRFHKVDKFEDIHFYPERLYQPGSIKRNSKIFIGSMCDLFAEWTPQEYVKQILEVVRDYPEHTFIFLTKNPKGYNKYSFPENCWLGVTITKGDAWNAPVAEERINFISCEPLLGNVDFDINYPFDWIIIGALTGHGGKYQPKKEWIKNIIRQANFHNTPIFMKNNLKNVWDGKLIQEFPK
jgi:protein gp37